MSAMHEDMHQRACEEEKNGQIGDGRGDMRTVLRHQEVSTDREKSDQCDIRGRREKAASLVLVVAVIHCDSRSMFEKHGFMWTCMHAALSPY